MNKQIKPSKGIKITGFLMFMFGLAIIFCFPVTFSSITEDYGNYKGWRLAVWALSITNVFFVAPLFIIASIGLWKIKEWALFVAQIAFGALISTSLIGALMDIGIGRAGPTIYFEVVGHNIVYGDAPWYIGIVVFSIISIVYLLMNRKRFGD